MNLINSAAMLFGLVVGAVSLYLYRYVVEWQQAGRLTLNLARYAKFLCISALAACVALTVAYHFVPVWREVAIWQLYLLIGGNLVFASLNAAILYCVNCFVSRSAYVVLSNATAWFGLAIALIAVAVGGANAVFWLGGILASQAVVLGVGTLFLRREGVTGAREAAEQECLGRDFMPRSVFVFCWPLILSAALYWLQRGSVMSFVGAWMGMQQLGYFSVALSVGMLAIASFETVFREFYSPVYLRAIAGRAGASTVEAWKAYTERFLPSLLVVAVMVATCSSSVLRILAGSDYAMHAEIAVLGVWCQVMISVYSQYVVLANAFAENTTLLLPNVIGAIVVLALLVLAGRYRSPEGAALIMALGISICTLLVGYKMKASHGVGLPGRAIGRAVMFCMPMPFFGLLISAFHLHETFEASILTLVACGAYAMIVLMLLGGGRSKPMGS